MTASLRPLVPADLDALTEMAVAFHAEDGHPLSEVGKQSLKTLCDGDLMARGWMIEADGETAGYLVISIGFSVEYGGRDGFIDDLYLVPDARGRGLGKTVMALAEAEARSLGINALHLEVEVENARDQALYRGRGYDPSGRILMSKQLRSDHEPAPDVLYDRGTGRIETDRLLMTPAHQADPDTLLTLFNHPDVRRYLLDNEVRSPEWLEGMLGDSASNLADRGFGLWTCEERAAPGRMVGVGGFIVFRESGEPEMLYALLPDGWGRGLATEMATALTEIAFRDLGFSSVVASTDIPNTASERVMQRLGMTLERTDPDSGVAGEVFYRRTRADWECGGDTPPIS